MLDTIAAVAPFVSLTFMVLALGLSWFQSRFIKRLMTEYGKAEFSAYAICELEDEELLQVLGMLIEVRDVLGMPIPLREVDDTLRV